ncbi:MAG TPA: hypothetical protein VK166_04230 [Chitinophagaceae bacterium]|nr:hypothetical protein [Chitinophagaceae bacterium]
MVVEYLSKKRKYLVILVFILAILLRSFMMVHYFDISGDKIYQSAAALNISEGKGYTVPVVDPSNLNSFYNKHMSLWPAAYSYMMAPIISITGDPAFSCFLTDLLNNAIFLLAIYWAVSLLNFPFPLRILILLFKATEINNAVQASVATDYMAINIWLFTILSATQFITRGGKNMQYLFLFCSVICPWIRYSNLPIFFIIPALMIVVGRYQHNRIVFRTGILSMLLSALSIAALLYFNYSNSGAFFYVLETQRGFYPGNLVYLPPIVWMSFININFLLTQLSLHSGFSYPFLYQLLQVTGLVLLVLILVLVLRKFRFHALRKLDTPTCFFLLAGSLSLGTIGSLALLTITRSRRYNIDQYWTYIEEHRYLMIVTISLMLYIIFRFMVISPAKWLKFLILFIMISETLHGIWVIAKGPFNPVDQHALLYTQPETKKLITQKNAEATSESSELILMDEDYDLRGYGILNRIKIIDNPYELDENKLRPASKKKILFRIKPGHEPLFSKFFSRQGLKYHGIIDKYSMYELNIGPAVELRNN